MNHAQTISVSKNRLCQYRPDYHHEELLDLVQRNNSEFGGIASIIESGENSRSVIIKQPNPADNFLVPFRRNSVYGDDDLDRRPERQH